MMPLAITTVAWVFIVLPVVILWVLGVVDILRRPLAREKKAAWILVVILLPVIGTLGYFVLRKPSPEETRLSRSASTEPPPDRMRGVGPQPPLD